MPDARHDEDHDLVEIFRATIADQKLSRSEKRAIKLALQHVSMNEGERDQQRAELFKIARSEMFSPKAKELLDWLESALKVIRNVQQELPVVSASHFSPGDSCQRCILTRLESAKNSVDICVFSISDDEIAKAIVQAHSRPSVTVRIITDNATTENAGSDVEYFSHEGIEVRVDREDPLHMHHKFAMFDGEWMVTGSYNWTAQAKRNRENLLVTNEPTLVGAYGREFERVWAECHTL